MNRQVFHFLVAFGFLAGASVAHAQDPSEVVTRLDRLEQTIRTLTGSIEQLQYRNQQLEQQVQALQAAQQARGAEVRAPMPPQPPPPYQPANAATAVPPTSPYSPSPPRYSAPPAPYPVAGSVASAGAAAPPPAEAGRHDAFDPTRNPNAPGVPRALGTSTTATEPPPRYSEATPAGAGAARSTGAPLDLSRLSDVPGPAPHGAALPPPANPSAAGATREAALPPSNSPKDEFDLGYGYVQRHDYAAAAETFRRFLHDYPSDRLTPEAQFWLGESLFKTQQYHDAAEAFLRVSTKYETSARAPDALLRLGQSLAALGEKEAACASLGEVMRKYPRATLSVKQSVEREQKRVHC